LLEALIETSVGFFYVLVEALVVFFDLPVGFPEQCPNRCPNRLDGLLDPYSCHGVLRMEVYRLGNIPVAHGFCGKRKRGAFIVPESKAQ